MPLADLDARREYDRQRAKAKNKGGSCMICGAALPDGRRKLCGNQTCIRTYKTQKQRVYSHPSYKKKYVLSPEAAERRRQRQRERGPAKRPERVGQRNSWEWNLWHVHRMRAEQWFVYWSDQDGKCYLCEEPLPEDRSTIALDHDHLCCGKDRSCRYCRRGLAHRHCNWLLGILGDDPRRMQPICSDRFMANFGRAQAAVEARIATRPVQDALAAFAAE